MRLSKITDVKMNATKTVLTVVLALSALSLYGQKFEFEILNSTYALGQYQLAIDVLFHNKSKDSVFLVDPNHYLKNPFVRHLRSEPYAIEIYSGDECTSCHIVLMAGDESWHRDFSKDYILVVPPKKKVKYSITQQVDRTLLGSGNLKPRVKLKYNFTKASYRAERASPASKALFDKINVITLSEEAPIAIKD